MHRQTDAATWKPMGIAIGFAAALVVTFCAAAQEHQIVAADEVKWQPIPREWFVGMPPNAQVRAEVAIIHGDPNKEGEPFIMRLKSPPNSVLPAHWHEFDEHITILSGVWCVGMGDRVDPTTCKDLPAGSFVLIPKRMRHWAVTKDSVVEVHGIGPFRVYLVQ
jgi:quercetin dioxygenase-like cupin family protein